MDYNLFILNKAVAGAAVLLIGTSFVIGPLARFWPTFFVPRLYLRKYFGVFGFMTAALHSLLSLFMLSPAYYPKMFDKASGKMVAGAEISLFFAAVSFIIFSAVAVTSLPSVEERMKREQWQLVQRLGYIAFFLVMLHIAAIKWSGWFDPQNWLNGLPPASLIPFIYIIIVLAMRIIVMTLPPPETTKQSG